MLARVRPITSPSSPRKRAALTLAWMTTSSGSRTTSSAPCGWIDPARWICSRSQLDRSAWPKAGGVSPSCATSASQRARHFLGRPSSFAARASVLMPMSPATASRSPSRSASTEKMQLRSTEAIPSATIARMAWRLSAGPDAGAADAAASASSTAGASPAGIRWSMNTGAHSAIRDARTSHAVREGPRCTTIPGAVPSARRRVSIASNAPRSLTERPRSVARNAERADGRGVRLEDAQVFAAHEKDRQLRVVGEHAADRRHARRPRVIQHLLRASVGVAQRVRPALAHPAGHRLVSHGIGEDCLPDHTGRIEAQRDVRLREIEAAHFE